MDNMRQKYEAALLEIESLKREVASLQLQIKLMSPITEPATAEAVEQSRVQIRDEGQVRHEEQTQEPAASVHQYSKVEDKLALFRSYFRGREDVYPVRWNSKQGKSGYSPACGNSVSTPTTGCFPTRIRCPEEASAISSRSRFKEDHGNKGTVYSLMKTLCLTRTSGAFFPGSGNYRRRKYPASCK
nr:hypothetical protein [Paenibacillus cymbidii]